MSDVKVLKAGTVVIAVIYATLHLYILCEEAIYLVGTEQMPDPNSFVVFVYCTLQFSTAIMLFNGAVKEKKGHLLPWLFVNSLVLVALILAALRFMPKSYAPWNLKAFLLPAITCTALVAIFYQKLEKIQRTETEDDRVGVQNERNANFENPPPPYEEAIKYPNNVDICK